MPSAAHHDRVSPTSSAPPRRAALLGDPRWRDLLDNHDTVVRHELQRFGGREVNTAGDGFRRDVQQSERRARVLTTEIVDRGCMCWASKCGRHSRGRGRGGVGTTSAGMDVHIGARVAAQAGPSEVLVSSTVRDIVTGSRHRFARPR